MRKIRSALLRWFALHGRAQLPWRQTRDPYRILVSEFMLQQTQVDRVLPKYEAFVARFPDVRTLAQAETADVLRLWKGLGYNSRAVRLRRLAREIVERFSGVIPHDEASLRSLPGIGPYTVAAIRAFAFDLHEAAIDTNVRRVVHRLLFGLEFPPAATPAQIDAQARALVPRSRAHDWNSAMMDLGSALCTARAPKCLICPMQTMCAAAPLDAVRVDRARREHSRPRGPADRVPFERTIRFARGRIVDALRELPARERISLLDLHAGLSDVVHRSGKEFDAIVQALARDGVVEFDGEKVALPR